MCVLIDMCLFAILHIVFIMEAFVTCGTGELCLSMCKVMAIEIGSSGGYVGALVTLECLLGFTMSFWFSSFRWEGMERHRC